MSVGALDYELASREEEPRLRQFAREQSMPGWVSLSLEREPDYFLAGATEGDQHQVMIARERATGRVVAMHSRAVRDVFVDGQVRRLPYLGGLRTDPSIAAGRWRLRLLREGFAAARARLRRHDELPYELTAIVDDNVHARRLLEAGLSGLPRYTPIARWSTLALSAVNATQRAGAYAVRRALDDELELVVSLLNRHNSRLQLAPYWRSQDLASNARCRDLSIGDFLVAERAGEPVGCIAVWDQRRFKQTVVRGYGPALGRCRALINRLAPAFSMPQLPPVGSTLAQGWLSHLAHLEPDLGVVLALVRAALARARSRGLEQLLLGLADVHPARGMLMRHLRAMRYRSQLYLVHWEEDAIALPDTQRRLVHVETATL